MTWAVELSQYDISSEPRQAKESKGSWTIYVDGSSNPKGAGAGILIENDEGITVEYSLKFEFPTSNNQAEYEACLAGYARQKN